MLAYVRLGLSAVFLLTLAGCGPDYSPNTYSSAAVQQANKVEQGVIAGFREVAIRADGTVGAVTGGAAGGVLGAQAPAGGVTTALSAIGGTLIGGVVGTSVEHATGDTKAFEYLVRKPNGDLISVTQKDTIPLALGLKVLVIEGKQARVVADYSVPPDAGAPSAAGAAVKTETKDRDGPRATGPVPTQALQPAPVDTPPQPVSGAIESAPVRQPASPQAAAPEAAPTPAPQMSPAESDPDSPAAPAQTPPGSEDSR